MRIVITLLTLIVLIVLQLAFQDAWPFADALNPILVFLCVLLVYRPQEEILWLGLLAGALLDVFSGLPDGVMAVSIPAGLAGARYVGQAFFMERFSALLLPFYVAGATIASFAAALLVLGVFALLGWVQAPDWARLAWDQLPAALLLNLIFLAPVYWIYSLTERMHKRFWPKHESV
jgi:rod shape-determining protein MreD